MLLCCSVYTSISMSRALYKLLLLLPHALYTAWMCLIKASVLCSDGVRTSGRYPGCIRAWSRSRKADLPQESYLVYDSMTLQALGDATLLIALPDYTLAAFFLLVCVCAMCAQMFASVAWCSFLHMYLCSYQVALLALWGGDHYYRWGGITAARSETIHSNSTSRILIALSTLYAYLLWKRVTWG